MGINEGKCTGEEGSIALRQVSNLIDIIVDVEK